MVIAHGRVYFVKMGARFSFKWERVHSLDWERINSFKWEHVSYFEWEQAPRRTRWARTPRGGYGRCGVDPGNGRLRRCRGGRRLGSGLHYGKLSSFVSFCSGFRNSTRLVQLLPAAS